MCPSKGKGKSKGNHGENCSKGYGKQNWSWGNNVMNGGKGMKGTGK